MNWFELSVKVGADESVPVSLPTIYSQMRHQKYGETKGSFTPHSHVAHE